MRTTFPTFFRIVRPWRLWRELRMTHRCRPLRIVAPLLLLILLGVLIAVACRVAIASEVYGDRMISVGPTISQQEAIWQAIVTPFSAVSPAPGGPFGNSYPSPRRLHDSLAAARGNSWNSPLEYTLTGAGMVVPFLGAAILFQFGCGVAALTIPITLRSMKVRRVHLARITLYSLWLLAPAVGLAAILYALPVLGFSPNWVAILPRVVWWYLLAGVPLLTLVHWVSALRSYLRLPHPEAVAGAAVMMSAFATGLAVYVLADPGAAKDLFHPLTWLRALPGLALQ